MKTIITLIALTIILTIYSPIVKSEETITLVTTTKKCVDENNLQVCLNNICTTAPCTADKKCIENNQLLNGSQCLEIRNSMLTANNQRINEWRPFVTQAN